MGMVVRTNTMALNAYRQLGMNNSAVSKSLEKLSSGFKINRAGDDAAGLAISEKMKAQIKGLETASSNAQDGISLIQTAEGNLNEVHSMLNRMVELATKSANGTFQNEVDREAIQAEVDSLLEEIDRISESANFNGIKLLNGDLSEIVTKGRFGYVEQGKISTVNGIETAQGSNGAGQKGSYTIDFSGGLFGYGDTIKVTASGSGAPAAAALTFGVGGFTGKTAQEQAESFAKVLIGKDTYAQKFDITTDGSKVIIKAKEEGADQPKIDNIEFKDSVAKPGVFNGANVVGAANTQTVQGGWNDLFGSGTGAGTGFNVKEGDVLRFTFKNAAGVTVTADVKIDSEMESAAKENINKLTEAVAKALKDTSFNDNKDTAANESLMKVGDLFKFSANTSASGASAINGALYVEAANTSIGGELDIGDVLLFKDGDTNKAAAWTVSPAAHTAGAAGTAQIAQLDKPSEAGQFADGDKVTIKGTLSDGRTFEATVEAGVDFQVGAGSSYEDGLKAAVSALSSGTALDDKTAINVKVTGLDGKTTNIQSSKIFGEGAAAAAASGYEFKLSVDTGGVLKIESTISAAASKGGAGSISGVVITPKSEAKLSKDKVAGVDQGMASSKITFDADKIGYGAAVKIGDKTYELVKNANDVTNRSNTAVVIEDLENATSEDIAKAFMNAAADEAGSKFVLRADLVDKDEKLVQDKVDKEIEKGTQYAVSVNGGELTIETLKKGSDVAAPEVSTAYGDKIDILTAKLDPSKMKYGDSFKFNDNTYEFVAKAEDAKDGNIGIVVPDLAKATSKDLAVAFQNVAKNGTVTDIQEDGTFTVRSLIDANGTPGKLEMTFNGSGLTLQIGDTSDDFNKVSVFVENMSSKGLGVAGLNVLDQDSAGDAIDVIRNAINKVSTARANMGALQNRLEYTINNLDVAAENMSAANSRIRDTDMAKEMMNYTKMNVLVQSAQAMLAQANQQPQSVLQLLQ